MLTALASVINLAAVSVERWDNDDRANYLDDDGDGGDDNDNSGSSQYWKGCLF